jgi:hypothetical protein
MHSGRKHLFIGRSRNEIFEGLSSDGVRVAVTAPKLGDGQSIFRTTIMTTIQPGARLKFCDAKKIRFVKSATGTPAKDRAAFDGHFMRHDVCALLKS